MKDEDEVLKASCPQELEDSKYDATFPYSPLYVGYTGDPKPRFSAHKSSTRFVRWNLIECLQRGWRGPLIMSSILSSPNLWIASGR